ncbi:hypothetical protein EV361DRAFT_1032050 [Lentinula raphanica]|uniref:Uncharacterized protein n=1 Tax=Lentinula raphanica TaxID=153919 RepID=A0AA38P8Z6_9AGAR|nr:hypothetical protein F5878DRAFT_641897 [Lentinula raphanica]KAJ3973969.1 hypothetical protein EV361DRAFT_1032050 [Lentinula raphanica]
MRILFTPVFFLLCLLFSAFAAPIATWEDPPPPYSRHDKTSPQVAPANAPVVPVSDPPPPYSQHDNSSPQVAPVNSPVVPVTDKVSQISGQIVVDLTVYDSRSLLRGSIPMEDVVKLRNAVEILLPWFFPLARREVIKGAKDTPLPVLPDTKLSFQVATLTWDGTGGSARSSSGYYIVEVEFPERADFKRFSHSIYIEKGSRTAFSRYAKLSLNQENATPTRLEGMVLIPLSSNYIDVSFRNGGYIQQGWLTMEGEYDSGSDEQHFQFHEQIKEVLVSRNDFEERFRSGNFHQDGQG